MIKCLARSGKEIEEEICNPNPELVACNDCKNRKKPFLSQNDNPLEKKSIPKKPIKPPRKTPPHAFIANRWSMLLSIYANLAQKVLQDSAAQKEKDVMEQINLSLIDSYKHIQNEYLETCQKGDQKIVQKIIDALAWQAFEEDWFKEGVRLLAKQGIETKIKFKLDMGMLEMHNRMLEVEKKFKKGKTADNVFGNKIKGKAVYPSDYYKEYPQKLFVINLHWLYCFLSHDPDIYQSAVREFPHLDNEYLEKMVDGFYEKVYPNFPNDFLYPSEVKNNLSLG